MHAYIYDLYTIYIFYIYICIHMQRNLESEVERICIAGFPDDDGVYVYAQMQAYIYELYTIYIYYIYIIYIYIRMQRNLESEVERISIAGFPDDNGVYVYAHIPAHIYDTR